MFSERLKELFDILCASNTDIAFFAGVDRSGISRIKSGSRVPKPSSISTKKLIDGIFLFADDKNLMDKLLSAVSCPSENPSPDEIKQHILLYLYEGYKEQPVQMRKPKKKDTSASFRSYGAKLDAVMNIADISNVRFAKMLHIDASTISRFRNGLRTPKSNPKLTHAICNALFGRILELDRLYELLKLAKIPADLSDDTEECRELFFNWLCDFKEDEDGSIVEKLIDNIASFSADTKAPAQGFKEIAPDTILNDTRISYYGTDGLREAVIRFLGNAVRSGSKELWLYSDQNMGWMTDDIGFLRKWAILMRECIKSGIKIRIIHSITRKLDEMIDAINSWLPLYMSGMIDSYYCKKQIDSNFSHTLFLCPGLAAISGVHVTGCENEGLYRYDTDEKSLNAHAMEYNKLLDASKQLVWIYKDFENADKLYPDGNITALNSTLSLATMPENVLLQIISRNDLDINTKHEIMSEWNKKNRLMMQSLKNGYVHECVKTAEDELLFSGKISVDLQGISLTYTPQEYKEHIKNIITLSEKYTNYRFYTLPDIPFNNVNIVVSERMVMTERLLPPNLTIIFLHHAMCDAFIGYANRLKTIYGQDKITLRRQLERYL